MSTKYKFHDQEKLYFVTFAVINWIDLFIREEYKQIMLDSWKHCQQYKGLEIYGWCIMSSHIHMIIGTDGDKLEDIMRDMKKHTSTALKAAIKSHPQESRREWMLWMMEKAGENNSQNGSFQLWQQDNPLTGASMQRWKRGWCTRDFIGVTRSLYAWACPSNTISKTMDKETRPLTGASMQRLKSGRCTRDFISNDYDCERLARGAPNGFLYRTGDFV